jgi:hypothetical protein
MHVMNNSSWENDQDYYCKYSFGKSWKFQFQDKIVSQVLVKEMGRASLPDYKNAIIV